MKTAEEWATEIDHCQEVCGVMQQHELAAHVKQIQLDAMREGMRRAAVIVLNRQQILTHLGEQELYRVTVHELGIRKDSILTAAEQLTEKDL